MLNLHNCSRTCIGENTGCKSKQMGRPSRAPQHLLAVTISPRTACHKLQRLPPHEFAAARTSRLAGLLWRVGGSTP